MGSDYDWGCGYPSDQHTQRWLRDNLDPVFGWPDVARFSWGPVLEVLQKDPRRHGACTVRWPDDDEEAAGQQQQQRGQMEAFLGIGSSKRRKVDRHRMIEDCQLQQVESW